MDREIDETEMRLRKLKAERVHQKEKRKECKTQQFIEMNTISECKYMGKESLIFKQHSHQVNIKMLLDQIKQMLHTTKYIFFIFLTVAQSPVTQDKRMEKKSKVISSYCLVCFLYILYFYDIIIMMFKLENVWLVWTLY